jgi:hypothetical protein
LKQTRARGSLKLPPAPSAGPALPAQAQFLDEVSVALHVSPLKVVQKPAALADELQKPSTRVVIFLVRPQVLGEIRNALREQRHLHLR